MKKKGSKIEFSTLRDKELYRHFLTLLREGNFTVLRELYGRAAKMPASRFWVSELRAADVVSRMRRGREDMDRMKSARRAMFEEIRRRVDDLMSRNPGMTLIDAVTAVVNGDAPEFYISDDTARTIIYRVHRQARAMRRILRR